MKDYSKAWRISGSAALEAAAREHADAIGLDLSKLVDRAVRNFLIEDGELIVPPPLAPAKRGPKPQRKARR